MRDRVWDIEELARSRGEDLYSSDGEKIGNIEEFFIDDETGEPLWMRVGTGFLGMKAKVVPIEGLEERDGQLVVPYSKSLVHDQPEFDYDDRISDEAQAVLLGYYGLAGDRNDLKHLLRPEQRYGKSVQ